MKTDYDPQGNPGLPLTTNYEYNPFGQVNKITVTGADGLQHITRLNYIMDVVTGEVIPPYDEPTTALFKLFVANRIDGPVETCSLLKRQADQYERVVEAHLTNFKMFQKGNSSAYLALPCRTYDLSISSPLDFHAPNSSVNFTFSNNIGVNFQVRNVNYELTDVVDGYDDKWNPIQAHKNNDNCVSTIWGYGQSYPISSVINATADEIGFAGFENQECEGWVNYCPIVETAQAHTGKFVVKVNTEYGPAREFEPGKTKPVSGMKTSVWVKGAEAAYLHIEISGDWSNHQRVSNTQEGGEWHLLEVELTADQVQQAIDQNKKLGVYVGNTSSTDAFFDDIRVFPSDAKMTTYTIDPFFGITSTTDARNQTNWYEHDNLGRQTIVRDQDKNILAKKEFHIGGGQTPGTNWFKTRYIHTEVQDEEGLANLETNQHTTMFSYFDGLGRQEQEVVQQFTPNEKDFVQPVFYDGFGLKSKSYEPFAADQSKGEYQPDVYEGQQNFYLQSSLVAHTHYPFSQVDFERAPTMRTFQTSAPGTVWSMGNGHTKKQNYSYNNNASDGTIRKWILRDNKKSCYSLSADCYAANELLVLESRDENSTNGTPGGVTRSYYDQYGKAVLTRSVKDGTTTLDTYYVYDEFDQQVIVIPPKAVGLMSVQGWDTGQLNEDLVYVFTFDRRHRLVEKKIPGKDYTGVVYDLLDRVSLTQDGNLRAGSQWAFNKYDVFGRLIMTGIQQEAIITDLQQMQVNADMYVNALTTFGFETRTNDTVQAPDHYTNRAFPFITPNEESKPLTYYYYDQYPLDIHSGQYRFRTDPSFPSVTLNSLFLRLDGVTTVVKRRKLDPSDESFLLTVYYYDKYLRPIEVLTDNHLGGLDATFYEYDFEGKLLRSLFVHNLELPETGSFTTEQITETFDYDSHGRLKTHWHKINEMPEPVILAAYTYNELGQVVEKKLHSADAGLNFLQTVDYRYNPRGWLTNINRCDLANSNIFSTNETNQDPDELVNGVRLDSVIMFIDTLTDGQGFKYTQVTFNDKKFLSVTQADNPLDNYMLANDETATSESFQFNKEDSLQYAVLTGLNVEKIKFNLNHLEFAENDDQQELMDTIARLVDATLVSIDITDSLTRGVIINMVQVYEKSIIGTVYINNNANDLFGMDILYNEGFQELGAPGRYNGNISGIRWQQVANQGQRGYGFQYDRLGELTNSLYADKTITGWNANPGKYDEKEIEYDLNGNINRLKRTGPTGVNSYSSIDDLEYKYNGNQLTSVLDHAAQPASTLGFRDLAGNLQEYGYDANGNMIRDDNKGITSITYNYLNLPVEIHFDNTGNNKIVYLYDAFGSKLRKRVYTGGTLTNQMDYTSGALYSAVPGGAPELQYLATAAGRAVKGPEGFSYQYFLTDHLGNVRVVFGDDNNDGVADVVQDSHYYPYGMTMSNPGGFALGGLDNPFKYQGKEFQEDAFELGDDPNKNTIHLDLYDFHARQYDPILGRWHVPDPLILFASPYIAMGNNPVSMIDPTGMGPGDDRGDVYGGSIPGPDQRLVCGPGYRNEGGPIFSMGSIGCVQLDIQMSYSPIDGTYTWIGPTSHNSRVSGMLDGFGCGFSGPSSYAPSGGGGAGGGGGGGGGATWSQQGTGSSKGNPGGSHTNYKISEGGNGFKYHAAGQEDGYIDFAKATTHYRFGKGQPLSADANKLDWGKFSMSRFNETKLTYQGYPLIYIKFDGKDYVNSTQALVYGSVSIVKVSDNSFCVLPDEYNFDIKFKKGTFWRDQATNLGGLYAGPGTPFPIYFYGIVTPGR